MKTNKLKVLVAGSNGYIGLHLAHFLIAQGFQVVLTDLQPVSLVKHSNYHQEDMARPRILHELVKDVNLIFFCTGKTGTAMEAFDSPAEFISGNELTLVNLLEKLRKISPMAKIIFPSSRLIYRGNTGVKLKEKSEIDVKTIYAINKLACEKYIEAYSKCFGMDYTIFRISLPYGNLFNPGRLSYGVLPYLIACAQKGESLKIFGDGAQKRSLIHIHDLVEILIHGAVNPKTLNKIINVGGPDIMKMGDIIQEISEHFKVPCHKVAWPKISKTVEAGDTVFDSSQIDSILKYKYKYRFSEWLKRQA